MKKLWLQLILLLLVSALYAILRYVNFGPIPAAQIPLNVGNKVTAVAAAGALVLLAYAHYRRQDEAGQYWLKAAGTLVLIHVLISLSILTPGNYKRFFIPESGRYNPIGQWFVLMGILATVAWWKWLRPQELLQPGWGKVLVAALVGVHVTVMDSAGWFTPEKWFGGMPPISLWGAIFALAAVGLFWPRRTGP
ncbi:MAG: hypothetical protein WCJ97_11985 [Phycisphaerae bacterium]